MAEVQDAVLLRAQAELVRASGVLGRPGLVQKLFDFLLESSSQGKSPKEIEIAVEVFEKDTAFEVSQDALVRVYVHKLRRRLQEFYAGPGRDERVRIAVPKGEYVFLLEPNGLSGSSGHAVAVERTRWRRRRWLTVLSAALNGVLLAAAAVFFLASRADGMHTVRSSAIWAPILDDDLPVFIVLGDYYIFGETGETGEVERLVREFSINSHDDLVRYVELHPDLAARYRNLDLKYLPTGVASALREIVPVLAAKKHVNVLMRSDFESAMLKSAHIVYVGYLSGLGMLRTAVFAGSRLTEGDSYDELIDGKTGKRYISQAGNAAGGEDNYHDYGYFATFPGPSGNHVVIIAGTRDTGVMHTSEAVTRPERLGELLTKAGHADSFESLFEVYGVSNTNLNAQVIFAAPLQTAHIWGP